MVLPMKMMRKLILTCLAWGVALSISAPILLMVLTALKSNVDALEPYRLLFTPTLENLVAAASRDGIQRPLLNSVLEAGGATALCILIGLPAAYALLLCNAKYRRAVLLGMLMTRFMPVIGVVIPVYLIFNAVGLIDTRLGLIIIYGMTNLPIVVWMLFSYLREVPPGILESAQMKVRPRGSRSCLCWCPCACLAFARPRFYPSSFAGMKRSGAFV
jgi:sorbitol/mannitol transport system permease protein